ncbi:Uncharacterized protein Rs2_02745 [Raphanus sativus]|nr:Uncharacterized protein Rs2_02745 [Raphanus sativus]
MLWRGNRLIRYQRRTTTVVIDDDNDNKNVCNGGGLKNHGGGSTAEAVLVGVTFSSVLKMGRSDFGDLYYNLAQASSIFLRCEGYRGENGGYRGGGYIGGGYGGESDGYRGCGYRGGKREKWMKPH